MDTTDPAPLRLLVLDADQDTPTILRTLLHGRHDRPCRVDVAGDSVTAGGDAPYDVLLVECDPTVAASAAAVGAHVRAVVTRTATPPLVLLSGPRDRRTEAAARDGGAVDVLWKEELSAPHLEAAIRHAWNARRHALAQHQCLESRKLETIGRLAAGVAHDFNNILTAIVGFGGLVGDHVRGNTAAEEHLGEMLQAAERAAVLTRQLLAFGQRQALAPTRLRLDETLEGIASLIARLVGDGVELRISGTAGLPAVRGDRARLESALLTLVLVARATMPRGGRLSLDTQALTLDEPYCASHVDIRPGRYVRLTVTDTGRGLSSEAQRQLFDPAGGAWPADADAPTDLSAVAAALRDAGGHILVYSEVGLGTTFKLYLPVDGGEARTSAEAPEVRPVEAAGGGGTTILLVEDAPGIRRLAGEVIRRAGYRVLEAGDPLEAHDVAAAHQGPIDLLLTDIMMPNGNGVDLAGRLAAERPRLNVLFMSGYTGDAVIRDGILAGSAPFLQKPFTPKELLHKVREVLALSA